MDKKYVVDLSQQMRPEEEVNFPFSIDLKDATESMPELEHDADAWYKIGYVSMCTHNGTHVEVPYHHLQEGMDLAEFPLHQMIGSMVLMDFSHKKIGEEITLEEVRKYDGKIQEGDIVFIKTGMDSLFRTGNWVKYPYVALDTVHYLIDKKIGCLGTDAAGIEDNDIPNQPAHVALFRAEIPLVESLTNLDAVKDGEYMVFILPLPIVHGDASPVRVTAVAKSGLCV